MGETTPFPWAVTDERLKVAVERLVVAARPTRVLLFGTHARGDADSHSDVDLMVVEAIVPNRFEEMIRLRRTLDGMLLPIDLLIVCDEEVAERSQVAATVEQAAGREGAFLTRPDRAAILLRKARQDEFILER